jgi:hypothetical protein
MKQRLSALLVKSRNNLFEETMFLFPPCQMKNNLEKEAIIEISSLLWEELPISSLSYEKTTSLKYIEK